MLRLGQKNKASNLQLIAIFAGLYRYGNLFAFYFNHIVKHDFYCILSLLEDGDAS